MTRNVRVDAVTRERRQDGRRARRWDRAIERQRKKAAAKLAKAAIARDKAALAAVQSRATDHVCALSSHAVEAGVELQTDTTDYHGFHTALGEPTCPWCMVCEKRAATGLGPTLFNDRERAAWLEKWAKFLHDAANPKTPEEKIRAVLKRLEEMSV